MSEYSEAFESWAQKNGYAMQRAGAISRYIAPLTQCAWLAWKAGAATTLTDVLTKKQEQRITELEATMDEVLALIDNAPHSLECGATSWDLYKRGPCDCWKSKIGSK